MTTPEGPCPCGWGEPFAGCCGRYLGGRAAPTAEALMRSRYTAFAVGDREHLLRTWDPATRPDELDLDPGVEWRRLLVLATTGGSPFDDTGTVEFEAHYRQAGRRGVQHENSAFTRVAGVWLYVGPVGNLVA
ncbi:YchJ family metal-binding protein [Kineococcus sp. NBC_00420]|uniref:YchJ family protein n=1 Tax=Kineococcus sp. NBC_00420 TaxID=2903564 RepID=UPI002E1E3B15